MRATSGRSAVSPRTAPARPGRRTATSVLPAVLGALLLTTVPASPALAAPAVHTPSRAVEGYAPYQGQTTCNPTPKPGMVALRNLVLRAYGGTGDYGIARACSIGGRSEHKEGRAWDWKVNAGNPVQARQAADLLRWMLAPDRYGNQAAQARRLGVMYLIWNRHIWSASQARAGWRPYTGADPHTSHVHLSLSWAGALKRTSYWTGVVAPSAVAPRPPAARPAPATPPAPPVEPTHPTVPPPVRTPLPPPPAHAPVPAPVPDSAGPITDDDPTVTGATTWSVDVPSTVDTVTTTFALQQGARYLLTATGSYTYAAGLTADAECSQRPDDGQWRRTSFWESRDGQWGDLDLSVNGRMTSWTASTGGRCDVTNHAYGLVLQPGTSGPLTLAIVVSDPRDRSDNAGALHVTVRRLT